MTSILDKVAAQRPASSFRPTTVREFFVFRLADKLGDRSAAQHYAELAREHSDAGLLFAYRKAVGQRVVPKDLGRSFHVELARSSGRNGHFDPGRLVAIKVERRSIAIAVFIGTRLDFHDVRQLSSQPERASASAVGFVNWALSSFAVESATVERMTNGNEIRRAVLNEAILTTLRASAVPIWEVNKRELLDGFAHPPLPKRSELRASVHTLLWSMFNTDSPDAQELDAAALGLYVQTERLFL
jgi:hypothetical protein